MVTEPNAVETSPEHAAFLRRVHEAVEAAQADPEHPADELDRIDRVVRQRLHPASSDRLTRDVGAVAAAAQIDLDVPTESRIAVGRGVKTGVKKLVRWYVDPLGHQVAVLGGATASFASATSREVDRLEREIASLQAEVSRLADRLDAAGSHDDGQRPAP